VFDNNQVTMSSDKKCFVVNLAACEEKFADKFLHGEDAPGGLIMPSMEEVKAKVMERGVSDVVIVKKEKSDETDSLVYFMYVCPEDINQPPPKPLQLFPEQTEQADEEQKPMEIPTVIDLLRSKCSAIGLCFEALPLLIDEVKKQGRNLPDTLAKEITAKQTEFTKARVRILLKLMKKTANLNDLSPLNTDVTKWHIVVFNFLKTIIPPPPPPSVYDDVQQQLKNLEAELAEARKRIAELEDENVRLLEENEAKQIEIEEMANIPKPVASVDDLKMVGTDIEFNPVKNSEEGKDEVVYSMIKTYSKHHFVAKELIDPLVAEGKLDLTQPVKCYVEELEPHRYTDGDIEEIKVAQEYNVPKGEEFFICYGKVSQ